MEDLDRKKGSSGASSDSEAASVVYNTNGVPLSPGSDVASGDVQNYAIPEDRKIGITGAVFLILNRMIGTGGKWSTTSSDIGRSSYTISC